MLLTWVCCTMFMVQTVTASPVTNNQQSPPAPAQVLYNTADMPNSYNFHYDDGAGSMRTEQGSILDAGTPEAALDVLGTVQWYDNKGHLYKMSYKAGKRGYRTIIKKIS